MNKTKFVKIISCMRETYWYAKKIGEIIQIQDTKNYNDKSYLVEDGCVTSFLIDVCDYVELSDSDAIKAEIEIFAKKVEIASQQLISFRNQRQALEAKLKELNTIKLSDMVAGNVFENGNVLYIITPCSGKGEQKLTLTGLHRNPQLSYSCGMYSQEGMLDYLESLDAKKSNKKMVMIDGDAE